MNKLYKWLIAGGAFLPLLTIAQTRSLGVGGVAAPVSSYQDVLNVLDRFIGWFQGLVFVVAVIMILYAAFLYVTSGGDSGKIENAKNILIYAAIGIGVALLAYAIEPIVKSLLGASAV